MERMCVFVLAESAHQKRNVAFLSTVPVGGMVCVGD